MKRPGDRASGGTRWTGPPWRWSLVAALVSLGAVQACDLGLPTSSHVTRPTTVWVQTPVWVAGRATDPDGKPVAGASVDLESDNLSLTGKTGSGGGFAFRGVTQSGCLSFPCPLPIRVNVFDARRGAGEAADTVTIASPQDSVRLRTVRLDVVVTLP